MARIASKATRPEREVAFILKAVGCRFKINDRSLPGTPDFVIGQSKTIVFVHGCFWHMHRCKRGQSNPIANAEFWSRKRAVNRDRDRRVLRALRRKGWQVLVVWECQLRYPERLKERLMQKVQ